MTGSAVGFPPNPCTIVFFVSGIPVPAGSKRAFIVRPKVGRERVAVADSSGAKGKAWRAVVQLAAQRAHVGPPLEGPLAVELRFVLPRPKGHFGVRGLRASAKPYPASRPDVDKLSRAILDSGKGVLWLDDGQVCWKLARKDYGDTPGVHVFVRPMEGLHGEA